MKPEDVAMKLLSCSATCEGNKCPYRKQCKGDYQSCKMIEVALMLRAEMAELTKLRAEHEMLKQGAIAMANYMHELEKVNSYYFRIISKFQEGYRTKYKVKRKKPVTKPRTKKKPIVEMDGDERYAMPEEPKPPKDPVVII